MASGPASNRAANNGRRSHSSGSLGGSSGGLSFGASKQAGWLAGHSWLIGRAGWLDRNQRLALGARAAKRLAPNFQIRALASGGRRRANRVDEMTNNPHLHCDRRSPTADNRQQCASRPAGRPARRANESGSLCAVLPAGRPRGGGGSLSTGNRALIWLRFLAARIGALEALPPARLRWPPPLWGPEGGGSLSWLWGGEGGRRNSGWG